MLVPVPLGTAGGGDAGFAGSAFRGGGGGGGGGGSGSDSVISIGGSGLYDALTLAKFGEASGDARPA